MFVECNAVACIGILTITVNQAHRGFLENNIPSDYVHQTYPDLTSMNQFCIYWYFFFQDVSIPPLQSPSG